MTAVAPSLAQGQRDCRCGLYRSPNVHSPFCTVDEWRWSEQINRLLETIRRQAF